MVEASFFIKSKTCKGNQGRYVFYIRGYDVIYVEFKILFLSWLIGECFNAICFEYVKPKPFFNLPITGDQSKPKKKWDTSYLGKLYAKF